MRKRHFLVGRTDVDNFACSFRFNQVLHEGLCGEKCAFEVDVENSIVVGFSDIPKVCIFAINPSIIYQNIQLAKVPNSF